MRIIFFVFTGGFWVCLFFLRPAQASVGLCEIIPYSAVEWAELQHASLAPVATLDNARRRLEYIGQTMAQHQDPRGLFPVLYGVVLRHIEPRLYASTHPAAWRALTQMAVVFARRYLRSLGQHLSGAQAPSFWQVHFQVAGHCPSSPMLVLGTALNAHLSMDLPAAIAASDLQEALFQDYLTLGDWLVEARPKITARLLQRYGVDPGPMLDGFGPGFVFNHMAGPSQSSRLLFASIRTEAWVHARMAGQFWGMTRPMVTMDIRMMWTWRNEMLQLWFGRV